MSRTWLSKFMVAGVFIALLVGLTACGSSSDSSTSEGNLSAKGNSDPGVAKAISLLNEAKSGKSIDFSGSSGKTIGVMIPWTDNEGFQAMYVGVASEVIDGNAGMITISAQEDVETGVAAIEDFIAKKVDVIALNPFEAAAFSPVIKKANAAGIPVVIYGQLTEGDDLELAGSYVNEEVAVGEGGADLSLQAAEAMDQSAADTEVIELLGSQASVAGHKRHEGFGKRADELGLDVVAELPTEWEAAEANAAVLDGLQAHPDASVIFMPSGCALWEGVQSALKSLGRLGKKPGESGYVAVVGVDGCTAEMNAIREDEVFGSSTEELFQNGQEAGARAVEVSEGKDLSSAPVVLLPPKLVTASNVEDKDNWANVIAGN